MFSITQWPSAETFSNLSHPQQLHFVYDNCRNFSNEKNKHIFKIQFIKISDTGKQKSMCDKTFHINPIKIGSPITKNLTNN